MQTIRQIIGSSIVMFLLCCMIYGVWEFFKNIAGVK